MEKVDDGTPARRRTPKRSAAARTSPSRTSAEEILARSRAERAQLEQGKLFQAQLVDEAEQLHEEILALHEGLREVYRQIGNLRKRFTSLPPVPRLAGYPPVVVAAPAQHGVRAAGDRATA
ncbi:hypothetical protein ACWDSF_29010 [Nocardia beijingensis]